MFNQKLSSDIIEVNINTLRRYYKEKILTPKQTGKGILYSLNDLIYAKFIDIVESFLDVGKGNLLFSKKCLSTAIQYEIDFENSIDFILVFSSGMMIIDKDDELRLIYENVMSSNAYAVQLSAIPSIIQCNIRKNLKIYGDCSRIIIVDIKKIKRFIFKKIEILGVQEKMNVRDLCLMK